ncbi:MAG: hypothetical protein KKE50_05175 [Nanoarchaeota archaeon]|nr:hypothetical protein [Nanoarchaeota archaeon]
MKDLVEVIFGGIERVEDLIESLRGFCSCVGCGGSHVDEGYIKMVMEELESPEYRRIMRCVNGSVGILPCADLVSQAYDGALDIASLKPSERAEAAQNVLGYLYDLDDGEVEEIEERIGNE